MTHCKVWVESAKLMQNYLLIDLNFMSPDANMLQTTLTVKNFLTTASGKERFKKLQA